MCGVGAILRFTGESVVEEALELMAGLQNRGQEACGIAVTHTFDRTKLTRIRKTATPAHEILANAVWVGEVLSELRGNAAVVHTRYATALDSGRDARAAQPHFHDHNTKRLIVASNGDLPYCGHIRRELEDKGYDFASNCDAEVLAHLLGEAIFGDGMSEEEAFLHLCQTLDGAFSLCAITPSRRIFAMRDRWGLRPLGLARFDDGIAFCSEPALIEHFGAVEELPAGTLVTADGNGKVKYHTVAHPKPLSRCSMEYFYFSQPTSTIEGESFATIRFRLGQELAEQMYAELRAKNLPMPDLATSVPYSGDDAAEGFVQRFNELCLADDLPPIHLASVIRKDRFVPKRLFQQEETARRQLIATKFRIDRTRVKGKRVVIIDDSIVRSDQSTQLTHMVYRAGAESVYYGSTAPMMPHPCFFGINTPNRSKLVAHGRTLEQIREKIGCKVLCYLPIEALYRVVGHHHFCTGCFTGNYPMSVPENGNEI